MGGGPVAAADHGCVDACECWHVQAVVGGGGAYRFAAPSGDAGNRVGGGVDRSYDGDEVSRSRG
jgi:hypothetical protein